MKMFEQLELTVFSLIVDRQVTCLFYERNTFLQQAEKMKALQLFSGKPFSNVSVALADFEVPEVVQSF